MNLATLPVNEELQELFESNFLLHISPHIIVEHPRAEFLVVFVKHFDKIILELITTLDIFAKNFGFCPSLFSISGGILNSIANQVLCLWPFKKP
jgi:hypothetical protein